ncbi:MAG: NAD(P)H-hydrate dehydratase [Lachnospiraceae bacterium]|nr:NAD(P)H-hydrate dehydratase [Lachnospiraceae bacterium]
MEIITNSVEMKQCDTNTIAHYGVPSLVLMERAALGVLEEIKGRGLLGRPALVICGLGNNGGDGLAIARLLHLSGSPVTVLIADKEEKMSAETKQQYEILARYGIAVVHELQELPLASRGPGAQELPWASGRPPAEPSGSSFRLVVDALFGIGLGREIQGTCRQWLEYANSLNAFRLAVDIPSGINAGDGQVMGCAFLADLTVTFAYRKLGHLLYPGSRYCGEVVVKDIGITRESWLGASPSCLAYGREELALLPRRPAYSNKGTFGKVLVIAGKKNMAGAAVFSAQAALASGCGLVKVFTAEENRVIVQQLIPEAILETYDPNEDAQSVAGKLAAQLSWADAAVAGPGIGTEEPAISLVECVLRQSRIPVVLDADGLNICGERPGLLAEHSGPVIITPHLGEMARLTGLKIPKIRQRLLPAARDAARTQNVVCVLKDARTVIATPKGQCYVNTSGNHGMATAGSGDVLTGILAALLAQGMKPEEAAPLGVYLHGLSGDAAALKAGHSGMMARDILWGICSVCADAERDRTDEGL